MAAIRRQRTFRAEIEEFTQAVEAQAETVLQEIGDMAVEHVRVAYDRPTTGRGFTNRTFKLRRSVKARANMEGQKIVLHLEAGRPNALYASYVEQIRGGEFAYLTPAIEDMLPVARQMIQDRLNVQTVRKDTGAKGRSVAQRLIARGRAREAAGL
jgi:hypothetical protein